MFRRMISVDEDCVPLRRKRLCRKNFFPSPSHPCGVFRGEKLFSTKIFSAKSIQALMSGCGERGSGCWCEWYALDQLTATLIPKIVFLHVAINTICCRRNAVRQNACRPTIYLPGHIIQNIDNNSKDRITQ
jgi:hypothetical protein